MTFPTRLIASSLLLFLTCIAAGSASAATEKLSVSTEAQMLVTAVPEKGGIVIRRFRLDAGSVRQVSRFRLSETDEATQLFALHFSPDGRFAYVLANRNGRSSILQFRLNSDGTLVPLLPSQFDISEPQDVFEDPLALSPDGQFAYVTGKDGLWQLRVGLDGTLTPLAVPVIKTGQAIKRPDVRQEVTKPGEPFSTYDIENGNYLAPVSLTFRPTSHTAFVINREYFYKGFQRVVPNWAVQGGGGWIDVARTLVTLAVGPDGSLKPVGVPLTLPPGTTSLTFSPDGRFAASAGSDQVAVFSVSGTGDLRRIPGPALSGNHVCFGGDGSRLYVAHQTGGYGTPITPHTDIVQYRLKANGMVSEVSSVTMTGIVSIAQMTPGQSGQVLCVDCYRNYPDYELDMFSLGADGTMAATPTSTAPVGTLPGVFETLPLLPAPVTKPLPVSLADHLTVGTLTGDHVYVLNTGENTISQYNVRTDGTLQPLIPTTVTTGKPGFTWPEDTMAVGESGHFLYVCHAVSGSLDQYRINPDGRLAPLSPPTVEFGFPNPPNTAYNDPVNHLLFVTDRNYPFCYLFHVQADGTLSPAPALARHDFVSGGSIAVSPVTHLLSVLHGNNDLDTYRLDPSGLTHLSHTQTNLNRPITFDPSGRFAYYGDGDGSVWQFRVGTDGSIVENVPRSVPADESPEAVTFTPDGQFAYSANSGDFYGDGSISQYRANVDGTLTALAPPSVMTGTSPLRLAVDRTGHFLYAISPGLVSPGADPNHDAQPGTISQYRIGPNGKLTPLIPASIPTGRGPTEIVTVHQ